MFAILITELYIVSILVLTLVTIILCNLNKLLLILHPIPCINNRK